MRLVGEGKGLLAMVGLAIWDLFMLGHISHFHLGIDYITQGWNKLFEFGDGFLAFGTDFRIL